MITPRHSAQQQEERSFFSSDNHRSRSQNPALAYPLLNAEPTNGHRIGMALATGGGGGAPMGMNAYADLEEPGEHDDTDDSRSRRASLTHTVKRRCMSRWMSTVICITMLSLVIPLVVRYGKSFIHRLPPAGGPFTAGVHTMLSHSVYDSGIELRGSGTFPEFVYAHPVSPRVGDVLGGSETGKPGNLNFARVQGGTDGPARVMTSLLHDQCSQGQGVVLDIGSNYGYYSLVAASHGCRAVAIDIQCWKHDFLEFSRSLNGLNTVEPRCGFVGRPDPQVNGVNASNHERSNLLEVMPLDSIIHEDLLVIKLDVGTRTWDVISSGAELFEDYKVQHLVISMPPIANYKEETVSLLEWARANEYDVRDVPRTMHMDPFQKDRYAHKPELHRRKPDHKPPKGDGTVPSANDKMPGNGEKPPKADKADGKDAKAHEKPDTHHHQAPPNAQTGDRPDQAVRPDQAARNHHANSVKDSHQNVHQAQGAVQNQAAQPGGNAVVGQQQAQVVKNENVRQKNAAGQHAQTVQHAQVVEDENARQNNAAPNSRDAHGQVVQQQAQVVNSEHAVQKNVAAQEGHVGKNENVHAGNVAVQKQAVHAQGHEQVVDKENVVGQQQNSASKQQGQAVQQDNVVVQNQAGHVVQQQVKAVKSENGNVGQNVQQHQVQQVQAKPAAGRASGQVNHGAVVNPAADQANHGAVEQHKDASAVQHNILAARHALSGASGAASIVTAFSNLWSMSWILGGSSEGASGSTHAGGHEKWTVEQESLYFTGVKKETMQMSVVHNSKPVADVVKGLASQDTTRTKASMNEHGVSHAHIFLLSKRQA